jgi:hypothetical protein
MPIAASSIVDEKRSSLSRSFSTAIALETVAPIEDRLAAKAQVAHATRGAVQAVKDATKGLACRQRSAVRVPTAGGAFGRQLPARLADERSEVGIRLPARMIDRETMVLVLLPEAVGRKLEHAA